MFISYYVLLRRHLAVMDTTQICVYLVYGACIMGGGPGGWSGEVEVDKRISTPAIFLGGWGIE